ncbi:MAG TPA: pitrilysin family protein [Terriglobia bacterium]|nr:pitrilysin family protein [Terriglobia bacterium]
MWKLAFLLLLQAAVPPQRDIKEIIGPFVSREDEGQTTKVVLKNGLTVIVREEYAVPLTSITTLVKAGYFDEEDRLAGISHVVEHMLFKGTPKRPGGEIARQTRALGGSLNGYTDYDRTVYSTVVPAANAFAALEIQADALLNPSLDPEELKREVEVVLQENNRQLDSPAALATGKLYETAFVEHRIKRWIGTADGLRALTPEDVTGYHRKYYQPSNIILTIVGAADREKVLEAVVKLYAGATNAPVERDPSPVEPPQESLRYAWQRGAIQQSYLAMGFHVPGMLSEDARALEVLAAILGTGRSSRLNQVLRDEKGLITSGTAEFRGFRDMGIFELHLETPSPLEAATTALAEIENIKRFGVTAEAVSRAKVAIAQARYGRMETVEGVGDTLAYYEALRDWNLAVTYLSDIQRVTPQRVADAARKHLTAANLGVFEYLSDSVERYMSAAEYKAAVLDKVDAAVARRTENELPVTAQIPQRNDSLVVSDMMGTIQRRSIQRGPDVYILEDHRLPIVSFGIFFPGGRLMETDQNAGITELTLRTALRGTQSFDSAQIARRLENAGVRLQVVNEPDFFGYMLHGLAARMDQAIQVLVEILQEPTFEEASVVSERNQQLQRIRSLRDDNVAFPTSLFMRSMFGDAPYARSAVGTADSVGKITAADVRNWFARQERKLLPTIVIVGNTRGTALVAPIADALTNEDLETRDLTTMPRVQPASGTAETAESTNRQQTALVYGFPGAIRSANERYALDIVANVVSGGGLAYLARTTNVAGSRGGTVYTYAAFSPDKEKEVRALLDGEYARLRKEGISAEELKRAAESAIGARDVSLQTRDARVLEYARAIYAGAGAQSVARYDAGIRAVTTAQVKTVIDRMMDPAGVRVGIARGRMP